MTLESRLDQLHEDMHFPATPDFSSQIAPQIAPRSESHHWRRRLLLVAAAILLLVIVALSVPQTRTTLANWLHAGGIRLEIVDRFATDDEEQVAIDSPLILGDDISLAEAVQEAGMPLFQLAAGEPDRVFIRRQGYSSIVSLVYPVSDAMPEIADTGIGALLMQVRADGTFIPITKKVMIDEGYEFADVSEGFGIWITAGQLDVTPYDPGGVFGLEKVSRLTGNVLIWESNGIGYRLETALSKQEAIALAEQLIPVSGDTGNQGHRTVVSRGTHISTLWLNQEDL